MDLKGYQQQVIQNLELFLQYLKQYQKTNTAFEKYWEDKIGPYDLIENKGMKLYKNNIPNTVHVCLKVPTAGGKTFLACNALYSIFQSYETSLPKAVIWLVPWSNLLDQTYRQLNNPRHPYRQKLDTLFTDEVRIYRKEDLLMGANFSPTLVQGQLTIIVMNINSLRTSNKEGRKVYQENGQLMSFVQSAKNAEYLLGDTDESALINVIRSLNPMVVVDESHNAESKLSVEMLQSLNPSFILDLTATPRDNSNIISIIPAIELKKEHMVKLPVIVYNHEDKTAVIASALKMRENLESRAKKQHSQGGKYIRPIILFQAQPKTKDDNITFDKIKKKLVSLGIPEAQIKIKTADKNELKGQDLMSPACEVRYIITVNALKEGWDCPFAYILASLADKSSHIDVEQILGRVLRQPYTSRHPEDLLNLSYYVLIASDSFRETLDNIVQSLQNAGFSEHDYRYSEETIAIEGQPAGNLTGNKEQGLFAGIEQDDDLGIDSNRITYKPHNAPDFVAEPDQQIADMQRVALEESKAMDERMKAAASQNPAESLNTEMKDKIKTYRLNELYQEYI